MVSSRGMLVKSESTSRLPMKSLLSDVQFLQQKRRNVGKNTQQKCWKRQQKHPERRKINK